jgi:hypothetical protein
MQPTRKSPELGKWANTIRLMREQDKRTDEQIRNLFRWCNQDEFWKTNILSPDKLRAKWDDLQLRRGNANKRPQQRLTAAQQREQGNADAFQAVFGDGERTDEALFDEESGAVHPAPAGYLGESP